MGKKSSKSSSENGLLIIAINKQARRDFEISNVYEAGIVLLGSEVKSIRAGGINLRDSYIRFKNEELFLVGSHISSYSHAPADAHEAVRDRKLLLHKREITKLFGLVQQKGFTLIPLRIYFRKGKCKVEFGLGKGKKLHDRREDIKAREAKREIDRALRGKPRVDREWKK